MPKKKQIKKGDIKNSKSKKTPKPKEVIKVNHSWLGRELKQDDLPKVFELLAKPMPDESKQSGQTPYGKDVVGIREQFITNRFNDILGNHWHYDFTISEKNNESICTMTILIGNWKSFVDVETVEKNNEEGNEIISRPVRATSFVPLVSHVHIGGSSINPFFERNKSSITNSFKKCAAKFGVGREAYERINDLDIIPVIENDKLQHKTTNSVKVVKDAKKDPLPAREGTNEQQDVFKDIMTDVNGIKDKDSFNKVKEKCSNNKSKLTPDQIETVGGVLIVLGKKYE